MTPNTTALLLSSALLLCPAQAVPGAGSATPPELWRDYDPNKGDFKEEITKQEVREGILNREGYLSAYVLGEEIRSSASAGEKPTARLHDCTPADCDGLGCPNAQFVVGGAEEVERGGARFAASSLAEAL